MSQKKFKVGASPYELGHTAGYDDYWWKSGMKAPQANPYSVDSEDWHEFEKGRKRWPEGKWSTRNEKKTT